MTWHCLKIFVLSLFDLKGETDGNTLYHKTAREVLELPLKDIMLYFFLCVSKETSLV